MGSEAYFLYRRESLDTSHFYFMAFIYIHVMFVLWKGEYCMY